MSARVLARLGIKLQVAGYSSTRTAPELVVCISRLLHLHGEILAAVD